MAIDVSKLLGLTQEQLGKKYVFGSAGPSTFDCSGLVQYVFKAFGVSLPHHAEDQAKLGTPVATGDIQAGDLVFSDWGDGPNSHVGIAVSKTQIIDAPHTGAVVRYDTLSSGYLAHVTAVRRVGGLSGSAGGIGSAAAAVTGGAFDAVGNAIKTAAAPLVSVGKLTDQLYKVFMPSNVIRIVSGIAGAILIFWGVVLLAREARTR